MKNTVMGIIGRFGFSDPVLIIFVPAALFLLAAVIIFLIRAAALRRRFKKAASSEDLFRLWISAQKHRAPQRLFVKWAAERGDEEAIRLLAASCRGEDFAVRGVFFDPENRGDLLRELTGNSEWYVRYFAYRMLLQHTDPRTARTLEDGLSDSHPLVRKTLVLNFQSEDREKFYSVLRNTLIHDPVYEVRKSAKERIGKDFSDLYDPPAASFLNADEAAHLLELADANLQGDRNLALSCLESDNRELVFPAAVFLDKNGVLDRLLAENSLDDPPSIDRNVRLLGKALEVHVSGFISRINLHIPAEWPPDQVKRRRGAALLAAARLLCGRGGTRKNINFLAEEVFSFFAGERPEKEYAGIYTLTLECIGAKGDEKSFVVLARELARRENSPEYLELLLPRIPSRGEEIFLPVLFRFFHNIDFPAREDLVESLSRFDADSLLPEIFRILNGAPADFPQAVRISALRLLGRLKLPYCLGRVLENLPLMPLGELKKFASLLAFYPPDRFQEKAGVLLRSGDSQIRAAILTILPVIKNPAFMPEIRNGLRDPDPEVRIAAVWALLEFGEIKLLNQETSMLRDPVERVRLAAAACLGQYGNPAAMDILRNIMADPHETGGVKRNIITGLGASRSPESLNLLAGFLDAGGDYQEAAAAALLHRTSKKDILRMVEIFRDAAPELREKLIPVFRGQGENAEPEILELLKDEVASLKPYLARILEETGYVEKTIRRLSHRDVRVRRKAALLLSLLETLPGFRGLVTAARDPDQEVRVLVVKALEKLNTPQGRDILERLKEDPDKQIRKYTHWALERLDSLAME
jgi:HEAT repeat protein